jgi:hypothetical protein
MGPGTQFVPPQGATSELVFTVPDVPKGCGAWEVTPGKVRSLKWERAHGGVRVTVPEFSLATAVMLTDSHVGEKSLIVEFQRLQVELAPRAAQWSCDLAREELTRTEQVETELEKMGRTFPDSAELLKKSRQLLEKADAERKGGRADEACQDADRAMRPLRILMRGHWDRAVRDMDGVPTASPYALSFYTLPRHWRFYDELHGCSVGANLLPNGDFELPPTEVPQGWLVQEAPTLDEVTTTVKRVPDLPHDGKQCLMLQVAAKSPVKPPEVLERTFVALHSPPVQLRPGSLVRITAWARQPAAYGGSVDGALLYDSVGGEALALRLTGADGKWHRYALYRRVPPSGQINVTVALTGMGTVWFDDLRIEPLLPGGGEAVAGSSRR